MEIDFGPDNKYKIRPLTRKDRRIVSDMIVKLSNKFKDSGLLNIIQEDAGGSVGKPGTGKPDNDALLKIGMGILKLVAENLEDDLTAWFASLLNVSVEVYDEYPIDIELRIIAQLKECPEIRAFFSGASLLSSGTGNLGGMFSTEKTPSDIKTD